MVKYAVLNMNTEQCSVRRLRVDVLNMVSWKSHISYRTFVSVNNVGYMKMNMFIRFSYILNNTGCSIYLSCPVFYGRWDTIQIRLR